MSWKKTPENVKRLKKSKRAIFHIGIVAKEVEERQRLAQIKKEKEKKNNEQK